jgi:acyl-CoA synthetase (AMP-forming)/AMP-acid ligase II
MNLFSLLAELADTDPGAVIAIDAHRAQPRCVSRDELLRRVLCLRSDLARRGIGRGDCVAVWLPNWSDTLVWQFATASLGAHVVGINTRYNVDEVAHVLQRARPAVVAIAHRFHRVDLLGTLRQAVSGSEAAPALAVVVGPHGTPPPELGEYDLGAGAWLPGDEADDSAPAVTEGDDLAVAFTTSGSTGRPKLAAHKDNAVVAHAVANAEALGVGVGDVVLGALPLSGVFGFSTAMAALAGGAACLLEPVVDAEAVLDDMARWGVTHVVGGDDLVGRLVDACRERPRDLSAWRWLGLADFAGRASELARWALRELGTVTSGVYGSSEVFALATVWPQDEPVPSRWAGGGRLVSADMRARAVDPVTEESVPTGEEGELQLRGANVVDAYLGDDGAAAGAFTPDGWFRTGDLVTLREDGAITFRCRMGDALRLRGFLVHPAEIESRLAAHDAVRAAKVVGIRGHDGATRAVAFVVPDRTVEPEELREWCAAYLARFKVPSTVHLIDEMPTTSGTNGVKIRVAALREWAQQRHDEERP